MIGRKKGYDRDEVLLGAMALFREHGFAGTSAEMLVQGLGLSRYALYNEFGSKQGLFDAALQRYDEQVVSRSFGPLEAPDAGLDEIRALMDYYAEAVHGPAAGRGCLFCNTAVEFGPLDPSGAGFVQRYFARISAAFENALSNAQARGQLGEEVRPSEEAGFFTASMLGIFVMLRAKAPAPTIESATRIAQEHLAGLQRR